MHGHVLSLFIDDETKKTRVSIFMSNCFWWSYTICIKSPYDMKNTIECGWRELLINHKTIRLTIRGPSIQNMQNSNKMHLCLVGHSRRFKF